MCDGYSAYDSITKTGKHGEPAMNVKPVACLVHVRRKFADALKLLPPKDRENTSAKKEQLSRSLSEERTFCFQTHPPEQMQAVYCIA